MSFYALSNRALREASLSTSDLVARLRQNPEDSELLTAFAKQIPRGGLDIHALDLPAAAIHGLIARRPELQRGLPATEIWDMLVRQPDVQKALSRFVGSSFTRYFGPPKYYGSGLEDFTGRHLGLEGNTDYDLRRVPKLVEPGLYSLAKDLHVAFILGEMGHGDIMGTVDINLELWDLGGPLEFRVEFEVDLPPGIRLPEDSLIFEGPTTPRGISETIREAYQQLDEWALRWENDPSREEDDEDEDEDDE